MAKAERQQTQLRYQKEILYCEDGETLEQLAKRSCGCAIPGNIPDQTGQGSKQPALVKIIPGHGREVGQDDL